MSKITIGRQFRGPPNSGNGGYVCGVLAKGLDGPVTAMLRAPPPLDTDLDLRINDGAAVLTGEGGLLIGQAGPATQVLPEPPPAPSLQAAREAGTRSLAHEREVHPPCFTCGVTREDGLRVLPGQLDGAAPGVVATVWTPDAAFADADGVVGEEIVWAALDCPGIFAWIETEGRPGGLLGTMTGEVTSPVKAGEDYVVLAWPIESSGRKKVSGVALYDGAGRVMARGHQVWITLNRPPGMPAPAAETATA